jgi:hypothetical protein
MAKTRMPLSPSTSRKVKREAGIGLADPTRSSNRQVQSLAGSVEAHIEPRQKTRTSLPKKPGGRGASKKTIDRLTGKRIGDFKNYLNCQEGALDCPVPAK